MVIAKAKVDGDPNYNSYRHGYKTHPVVDRLLEKTGIDLSRGGGVPELMRFQEHFKEYNIVVFGGLNCEDIIFDGWVESEKRMNLVYDDVKRHYHVINNFTGAMTRQYVCRGCNKGCRRGVTRKCGETCSDCKSIPPCMYSDERVPCESRNRNFRSRSCYEKHKTNKVDGKTIFEKVRNCAVCNVCVTKKNHECFKPYCANCNKNMEINHLWYMQPLKNELPSADNVLFVFYDFETTQDTKISETAKLHVSFLVYLQQFCTACEMQDDYEPHCAQCCKRRHSFLQDPVGDIIRILRFRDHAGHEN